MCLKFHDVNAKLRSKCELWGSFKWHDAAVCDVYEIHTRSHSENTQLSTYICTHKHIVCYIIWLFALHLEICLSLFCHCSGYENCKLFCWLIYFRPTIAVVALFPHFNIKPFSRRRHFSPFNAAWSSSIPKFGALICHTNGNQIMREREREWEQASKKRKNSDDLFMPFHTGDSMHFP